MMPTQQAIHSAILLLMAFIPSRVSCFQQPNLLKRVAPSHTVPDDVIRRPTRTVLPSSPSPEDETSLSAFEKEKASLLRDAFDALEETEQYDAVLTGLCAKILDGTAVTSTMNSDDGDGGIDPNAESARIAREATMSTSELAYDAMKDPINLMEEMNMRGIKASSRSLMALVDAAATATDPRAMSTILSLIRQNQSLSFYGALQASITPLPPSSESTVQPGLGGLFSTFIQPGKIITRYERLKTLSPIPSDNRSLEVSAALAAMGTVGVCLIIGGLHNALGLDDILPYTNFLLNSIVIVGVVDNFYDAIKSVGSITVKLGGDKVPKAIQDIEAPDKSNTPFGIGSGALTGNVVRGLTRLWVVDTERDCQCEAAAFFAAYSLGLPTFSFRPNALEGAILMFDSDKKGDSETNIWGENSIDTLMSDTGLMKMLIWLMAPVAMESSLHPQLIASDPREPRGFLIRLKEKASVFGAQDVLSDLLQIGDDDSKSQQEIEDLLIWAYAEADLLLRQNKKEVRDLTERLIGGASTVGDCVACLEGW